ncbi:MAG: hypothetical protein FWH55_13835 [Oscillospiraceae bacterium]|nr:hypothetical protein [Oscillospiraceae bacterium]
MQTGKSRTDIGFVNNKWVQGLAWQGDSNLPTITRMNWQKAHMGIFYRSTELQDNGYTYDYFCPEFLFEDGVYFN